VKLILKAGGVEKFFLICFPGTGLNIKAGAVNIMLPFVLFDI
jgi:hypothetical protein